MGIAGVLHACWRVCVNWTQLEGRAAVSGTGPVGSGGCAGGVRSQDSADLRFAICDLRAEVDARGWIVFELLRSLACESAGWAGGRTSGWVGSRRLARGDGRGTGLERAAGMWVRDGGNGEGARAGVG